MKTTFSIAVLCLCLLTAPAFAQLDPGPDGIGVYLDMGGMVNSVTQDEGLLEVQLLLMGCTAETGIQAWEAGIACDGSLVLLSHELPYEGFDVMTLPDIMVGVTIGAANDPIAQAPIMHLAILHFMVTGPEPGNIYVTPVSTFDGSGSMFNYLPAYAMAETNELRAMYPSSGSVDLSVFRVNGEAPVATTSASLDGVKALYR